MSEYYLYRHIRLDTNKVLYIGIAKKTSNFSGSYTEYKRAHCRFRRSQFWKNIILKTPYRVEILFESTDLNLIKSKETEFIKLYGRRDIGLGELVNHNDGGAGAFGNVASASTRRKMSVARLGKSSGMKGRNHKPETLNILRNKALGRKMSSEFSRGISDRFSGEQGPNSKFTQLQIDQIRDQYSQGNITQRALSIMYGTDQGSISCIVNRKKWKRN